MTEDVPQLLADMTWPEIAAAARANVPVLLAVGAVEQHGPHLPVGTDFLLPVGIALRAAQKTPLIIAPPILYGAHSRPLIGGGEGFPGTVSVRGTTLIPLIAQVLAGFAKSGFRRFVVFNWHLENAGFLWEACDVAIKDHPDTRVILIENPFPEFSPTQLAELFPGGFAGWSTEHASAVETSLMFAIRPDLVRDDRIVDDAAQRSPTWDVLPAPPEFIPETGVLARPSLASPELGERLLAAVVDRLAEAVQTEFGSPAPGV